MYYNFRDMTITASGETEEKAAELFAYEIETRTGKKPCISGEKNNSASVELSIHNPCDGDDFTIEHCDSKVKITAHRLRGLIYGYSYFLRKSVVKDGEILLIKNISCARVPSMKIRGHQISYTDMNNTYEAWDEETFRRYFLDMMFFGTNIIETTALGKMEARTDLMKYGFNEAMDIESKICTELDLDFSVWHSLTSEMTDAETVESVRDVYKNTPRLNVLFPPGGDPGDLQAEDFIERSKKMKAELQKSFPDIELWPSAQAPHEYADWGERFKNEMARLPDEIDGVIYGPNHAMSLDEMRRVIDKKYPIRLYPDIAHNVRCEIPVHFNRDDWHYALAATLSRESINPRPSEYRLMHRITRQYACGSVTYSEGANDDLNKMIWGDMDFDFDCETRESVRDYVRAFIWETDCEKMTDAVFGLEQNWNGDPAENSSVESTYSIFKSLLSETPSLMKNWRFVMHLFRAECDKLVRDRRIFELKLIDEAKTMIKLGRIDDAREILCTDFNTEYKNLRSEISDLAKLLFDLIGIQLDVEHFKGLSWERGCTLDTIDNPVTDRRFLINKINENNSAEYMLDIIERNKVDKDEYYFSFAEHGFDVCSMQEGEYYMNFCGDSNFEAKLPMCMTKVYDHFNFKTKVAGLTGGDYILRITYKSRPNKSIIHHRITVNDNVVHDGGQFGGVRDVEFEKKYLASGFESIVYDIKEKWLVNGCAELEITEPLDGFMFSEFWFRKK